MQRVKYVDNVKHAVTINESTGENIMNVIEMQVVSWTIGRQTRHARLFRQCGVFATALHYRNKGYSLSECLDLLRSSGK